MKNKLNKYICVHGHFYQPPRENPWTGKIDKQPSAEPFHDWNHRITDECYEANLYSKVLDGDGNVEALINNYTLMNFNFGPTLLSWMATERPDIYRAIIDADHKSIDMYNGHGAAMAQTYNHIIMPLANFRDKYTQICWGIRDFEFRFGRLPEGMWLSETAVNTETLDILAAQGIKYTVLAPHQAKEVKNHWWSMGWKNVMGGKIDTKRPYMCHLSSGRKIAIFFYDGAAAAEVAFGGLLHNGDQLANRLISPLLHDRAHPSLSHIATDGETYGHHHTFGNMALAYCFQCIQQSDKANITVYGDYLDKYPPTARVRINENSSWSCSHGIERWRSNCGCRIDASHEPHQQWRAPLRYALDWLRDEMISIFENEAGKYFDDPWRVRNKYIDIILNPDKGDIIEFFNEYSSHFIGEDKALGLKDVFDMQYYAMLMYTSCGWFFDDVSRIETVQILRYACRAIELARKFTQNDLEKEFCRQLEYAKSFEPKMKNGKYIYEHYVKPDYSAHEI